MARLWANPEHFLYVRDHISCNLLSMSRNYFLLIEKDFVANFQHSMEAKMQSENITSSLRDIRIFCSDKWSKKYYLAVSLQFEEWQEWLEKQKK